VVRTASGEISGHLLGYDGQFFAVVSSIEGGKDIRGPQVRVFHE
jgi:hypothetical protein